MMKCLVIGYGSIGKRHAQILKNLGCDVALVTAQKTEDFDCYATVEDALKNITVDYVVIANATHLHYSTLLSLILCNYQNKVLVEKPLFSSLEQLPENKISHIFVAYNLRFNELLIEAKNRIENEKLVTFSAYVGQYLPTWRKDTDYRDCYSAKKEFGGGALRDLSHELDYTTWFCGPSIDVTAVGGQFSELEINSDDVYSIIMRCTSCPVVNLQLNYLDRFTRREITINTQRDTLFLDLMKGTLSINGETIMQCPDARAKSYIYQHQAILNNDFQACCTYEDGLYVMKLINSIESATHSRSWMTV